jgi:hypothetical protein
VGLAGPVFALIEQPVYGFGDPLVWVPLVAGLLLLVAFVWHEDRSDHPMLPLSLFKSRNFAVGNLATLGIYGGLGGALFFVTIFLQQVAGFSPVAAGLALMPITVVMWLLSRRWGALSDRIGPRLLMGCGPLVAGLGLAWMGRLTADVDYLTDLLPAVIVFAVGLSATVAPLTNTVLGAVPQHHAGVASGVNNQIARVASLLAIAVLGAVVSAQYTSKLRDEAAALSPPQHAAALRLEGEVLAGGRGQPPAVRAAVQDASVSAYRLGLGVGGALVIVGGIVSLLGIVNPSRAERDCAEELGHGPSRLQQPCIEPQPLHVAKLPQRSPVAAPE